MNLDYASATEAPRYSTLDDLWRPPAPHTGRAISACSRGAGRATLIGGAMRRELPCESLLERKALTVLLARRDVVDVVTQPSEVEYVDEDGKPRAWTFDFLVQFSDDRRILFEVKPEKKAKKKGLRGQIAAVAKQDKGRVDGYGLITDIHLPPHRVHNAALVRLCRDGGDHAHDGAIRDVVAKIDGPVTIGEIVERSGLAASGFAAVIRLIDAGEISLLTEERIDYATRVRKAAAKPEALQ